MHTFGLADVNLLPLMDDSVDTIITDPPWSWSKGPRGRKERAASDYALLRDDEMADIFEELYRVIKPGGHCYVFVPERKLLAAITQVIRPIARGQDDDSWLHSWLRLKDCWSWFNTIVWVKMRKDRMGARMGLGRTYRHAHELILCLSKGRQRPLLTKSVPNVLLVPPQGGSRKPPEIYERIIRASTAAGSVVLDPFSGSDPLRRTHLDEYDTVSLDIEV